MILILMHVASSVFHVGLNELIKSISCQGDMPKCPYYPGVCIKDGASYC